MFTVILLPLRIASLTRKIHGMHPVVCKDRSIDRSILTCVFVEITRLCHFCGDYNGCCLTMHVSFSLCCKIEGLYFNFSTL